MTIETVIVPQKLPYCNIPIKSHSLQKALMIYHDSIFSDNNDYIALSEKRTGIIN